MCKRKFFLRKWFFIRPDSKENVFFLRIFRHKAFFLQKNYSKNQSHGIQSAENILFLFER